MASEKIDKLFNSLSDEDIEALFTKILHFRASRIQLTPDDQPNKRKRHTTGHESWSTVVKEKPSREQHAASNAHAVQFSTQNVPGFPLTLKGVPQKIINNPIAVRNIIKQVTPGINIKSQKTLPNEKKIILFPTDLASSKKLESIDLVGTPLEGVSIEVDQTKRGQLSILIAGIDPGVSEEEVGEELDNQSIEYRSVTRMKAKTGESTYKVKVELLDQNQKSRLIENGVYMGYSRHRVLDFKTLPNVLVCYNCQEFGHHAKDCEKPTVCVRCGEEHKVVDCTIPKEKPICCHCFGFHSAAYKGCPVYKEKQIELAEKREAEKAQRNSMKQTTTTSSAQQPPKPDYDKIANVLVEVVFLIFSSYLPDTKRNQNSFLSDLCLYTTKSLSHHKMTTCEGPTLFSTSKERLKSLGYFGEKK
jgi:hypothetical protein